ncbi:MAG: ribbon-helix-helix protein, CopG family [Chloroflexi bacterium]|nr:ribbon-helix-helix protein, CopG family [Chloroflexota bacterium]
MPNVMSTFSLDLETIHRLDRIAEAMQAGKSETIRKLVEEKFEQLQADGEVELTASVTPANLNEVGR